MLKLVQR